MLLPSADGTVSAAGITKKPSNANDIHEDAAEWQYLQQDRDEQAAVEKASSDAHNLNECLWCSDTTSAALWQHLYRRG